MLAHLILTINNGSFMDFYNIIFAFLGAVVGGTFTLFGVLLEHRFENKRKTRDSNEVIKATLEAIRAELSSLRERYMKAIGRELEKNDGTTPFLLYYYPSQDYFTLYNQNASVIGQIKLDNLRINIVTMYIQIKSLLDTYKVNSKLIEKYDYYNMLHLETRSSDHEGQAKVFFYLLLEYLPKIKELHKEAMRLSENVDHEITEYLNSQP